MCNRCRKTARLTTTIARQDNDGGVDDWSDVDGGGGPAGPWVESVVFAVRADSGPISAIGILPNKVLGRRGSNDLAAFDGSPARTGGATDSDGESKVASTVYG
jgi:hypothetical protein